MKRTRYCGDVQIELTYLGYDEDLNRDQFFCRVTVAGHVWQSDEIFVDQADNLEEFFDIAATGAVYYGRKYNIGWNLDDGCIPEWAPPRDIAQAINDAASVEEGFLCIRRGKKEAVVYRG